MGINLSNPPVLSGNIETQLSQLRSYLFQMSEQLNLAVNSLDSQISESKSDTTKISTGNSSKAEELAGSYQSLRSLIIKTSKEVNKEIDALESESRNAYVTTSYFSDYMTDINGQIEGITTDIEQKYVAQSEYGTYQETINNSITEMADGIKQAMSYAAELESGIDELQSGFEKYKIDTEGYIKYGIVEWEDDDTVPIYGVAVGQDIVEREVTVGGETYYEIDKTNFLATYSSKALKFWQNNQLVAYMSNNQLYITSAEVLKNLVIGDFMLSCTGATGLVIEYLGD